MTNTCYTAEQEQLASFTKAMGHPTRISMLRFFAQRNECFFGDIHQVLSIAKATPSQRLSELKHTGIMQDTIETPKVKCCINPEIRVITKLLFSNIFEQCCPLKKISCCS